MDTVALPAFVASHPSFYFFPVSPKSKKPLVRWRAESTNDPARIAAFLAAFPGCNLGVDCGKSGLVVIDVDVKRGKQGELSILNMELEGVEFDTLEVSTPSGGTHYYFQGRAASSVEWKPGVDIRSEGGYVVAPGSFLDGKAYHVSRLLPVADLPAAVDASLPGVEQRAEPAAWRVEPDKPENVEACRQWLMFRAPEAVEGQGGNAATYKVSAYCKDFGVSEEKALELMLVWNEEKAAPPWSVEELAGIIKNAYAYGKRDAGCEAPEVKAADAAAAFAGVPDTTTATVRAFDPPRNGGFRNVMDWVRTQPPEREWVIEGLIPKGAVTLLSGMGGTGKSSLAIQLGFCVASGTSFLNQPINTKMRVAYIPCEDPEGELHNRFHHIGLDLQTDCGEDFLAWGRAGEDNSLMKATPSGWLHGAFYRDLVEALKELGDGDKLLILDTLSDLYGGNENDRHLVSVFVKTILGKIVREHRATVVLLSHPPKNAASAANPGGAAYSGNSGWHGGIRGLLYMRYANTTFDDFRVLSVEKMNYGRAGTEFCLLRQPSGAFSVTSEEEVRRPVEDAILQAVADAEGSQTYMTSAPNSAAYYGKHVFVNAEGDEIEEEVAKKAVKRMIADGRLDLLDGKVRTGKKALEDG